MSRLPPMTHLVKYQKSADDGNLGYIRAQVDRIDVLMVLCGKVACGRELLPPSCGKILVRFNDDHTDPWASGIGRGDKHTLCKRIGSAFTRGNHEGWIAQYAQIEIYFRVLRLGQQSFHGPEPGIECRTHCLR